MSDHVPARGQLEIDYEMKTQELVIYRLMLHQAQTMAGGSLQEVRTAELLRLVAEAISDGVAGELAVQIRRWNLGL